MIRPIRTIDAHVGGAPLRLVVDGFPSPAGGTMQEKRAWLRKHADRLRRAVMLEPRGHRFPQLAFECRLARHARLSQQSVALTAVALDLVLGAITGLGGALHGFFHGAQAKNLPLFAELERFCYSFYEAFPAVRCHRAYQARK